MRFNKHSQLLTAIATLLLTTPLWATNGYFTHGVGTKTKGLAGGGLAMPEDAMSVANNPAAALQAAGEYDLGIAVFSPLRHYKSEGGVGGQGRAFTIGPNDIDSDKNYFFIPHMAGAWQINDQSAWSVAFYGRGGMNSRWEGGTASFNPGFGTGTFPGTYGGSLTGSGDGGTAGVDFSQAFLEFGYARSAGEKFTWGAALVGVMQVFSARGLGTFAPFTETGARAIFSGMPPVVDDLSNNGHDKAFGLGAKIGFQFDMTEKVAFAASYQSKINMSEFDDYASLFAEQGDFDIPANLRVGITFRPNKSLALNFDIDQIWYGDVDSLANPVRNVYSCPTAGGTDFNDFSGCFGGDNGGGFGWEDMTVYKVSVQWGSGNDWTWRAGISHGDVPIPEREVMFNILAPATVEDHITFGFTRELSSGNEMSMSFMYAPNNKVKGSANPTNPFESGNPFDPFQAITIDMNQWEIEFSYGWR
jgi:long-chain fatty acid transport protein